LENPALRGLKWDLTSPEVIEDVWKKIVKRMNTPDPFYLEKSSQNKEAMALYPFLEKLVNEDADPLYAAVKLAILGNSLDFMLADTAFSIENSIKDRINVPLSPENYADFKQQLQASKSVIYFGDNAGEIVFDKLLIQTLKKMYELE
jgi:uncharacterized protein with ATP-grasp and redox domains